MAFPFNIMLDGVQTEPQFSVISARQLEAEVLPREEWPSNPDFDDLQGAEMWLFRTPIFGYQDLDDEASTFEDQTIYLGDKVNDMHHGNFVAATLEPGYFYDVFCVGWRPDHTGFIICGCRYATSEIEVPTELTFGEAVLFGLAAVGVRPEDGQVIQAKVRTYAMWDLKGRVKSVDLEFGQDGPLPVPPRTFFGRLLRRPAPEPEAPKRYAVEVDHRGGVCATGGHSWTEVRQYVERQLENAVFA